MQLWHIDEELYDNCASGSDVILHSLETRVLWPENTWSWQASIKHAGLLQSTPSDLQERHRSSVELTYLEPLPPPISRQGSLLERINSKPSSRQILVPVPGGIAILTLVQFVCSLVEFAAKLNLLVSCVNNLSEKAGFTGDGKIHSRRQSSESQTPHLETVTLDS